MHKPGLALCLLALLTFSVPALAEAPGGGAPGSSGAPGASGAPGGGAPGATASSSASSGAATGTSAPAAEGKQGMPPLSPEKLAEVKAQIAKNIDTIIDGLQKRKACVAAATTPEALHACGGLPRPGGMRRDMPHPVGKPEGQQ